MRTLFICMMLTLTYFAAHSQTHLPPVAVNDSASVIQPYIDTINVTANDSSPSGDSFCIKKVYGSPFFTVLDCNNLIFKSDSSAFGNDTAMYVICNVGEPNLCDTGMVEVTVQWHYTPLMLSNARWITYVQSDCDNAGFMNWNYYWTTTDTIINARLYTAIYTNSVIQNLDCGQLQQGGPPTTTWTQYAGFLRQDTIAHKVYIITPGSTNEQLLYDFDLALGDTICGASYDTLIVNSISYYSVNESYYRQIEFNHIGTDPDFVGVTWIEGIGGGRGPVDSYPKEYDPYLICFSSNGQTYYPNYSADTCAYIPVGITTIPTIQTSIHPNPTTGFCTLQLSATNESLSAAIFDITGREVQPLFTNQTGTTFNFNISPLADGVYIVKVTGSDGHDGVVKLVKE